MGPCTRDGLRTCILLFADDIVSNKLLANSEEDLQVLWNVVKEWGDMMNIW